MACQCCGVDAPTKYVEFYQNIGALVVRFSKSIKGEMCKSCIHKYFWQYTLVNLGLGWWGLISLILTPFLVLNNTVRYLLCLGMEPVPLGAGHLLLTREAAAKIQPHAQQVFDRLNSGEKVDPVAVDTARIAGVTPSQVKLYVRNVLAAQAGKT